MTNPPASVIARINAYFAKHPGEELTIRQIAVKFSCRTRTVYKAIQALREDGEIESVHIVRRRTKGIAEEVQHG